MRLEDLKPYLALTIAHISSGRHPALTSAVLDELKGELKLAGSQSASRRLISEIREEQSGALMWSAVSYVRERAPAWLAAGDEEARLADRAHYLLLVGRFEKYLVCHGSEGAAMDTFGRLLELGVKRPLSFNSLESVPGPTMNAAFITGPARTLWLSGIHPSSRNKADSKILSGSALEDALDPLADQTYAFSAVRSTSRVLRRTGDTADALVGVSPRRSRIWLGPTKSWEEFLERTHSSLKVLKMTERDGRQSVAPLPVLATPLMDLGGVADAFDVALYPPPPAVDGAEVQVDAETAERWSSASFEVLAASGLEATVRLSLDGSVLGETKLVVAMPAPGRATCQLLKTAQSGDAQLLQEGLHLANERDWLRVRFDSGHSFANGQLHSQHFRDVPFNAWKFEALSGFNVSKEKPCHGPRSTFAPEEVGQQDSLFCWVVNKWAAGREGWLVCDDGADEIADFLHIDPSTSGVPILTLIHVKGAHSASPARSVSVSAYEIVTAQAMKNIRHLDPAATALALERSMGGAVGNLVWKSGGRQADRSEPIAFLRQMGAHFRKRVIVVQPHVTKASFDAARELMSRGGQDFRVGRLRQLDALLLSAEAECRGQTAEFLVISSE